MTCVHNQGESQDGYNVVESRDNEVIMIGDDEPIELEVICNHTGCGHRTRLRIKVWDVEEIK